MAAPDVAGNLARLRERIAAACARAGRPEAAVAVVAVTKTLPAARLVAARRAGLRDFGENRVQDALRRLDELPPLLASAGLSEPPVRWHFIGHLQRNKARPAVGPFVLLHAVDSLELCERLESVAAESGRTQAILIEVNLTREPQKHGCAPEAAADLVGRAAACPHLEPRGLMTMARLGAAASELHGTFGGLRLACERARAATGLPLPELSMGMSDDFEAAIEEGATIIRVGTALLGPRDG